MEMKINVEIKYMHYIWDTLMDNYILKINNIQVDTCSFWKNKKEVALNFNRSTLEILGIEYKNFESYQKAFKKFGVEI